MFRVFKLFSHSRTTPREPPPFEWSPVALSELIAAFLRQMTCTGRFLGVLNIRRGFDVRTTLEGSETAVSDSTFTRAEVDAHQVRLTLSNMTPDRAAFGALSDACRAYLSQEPDWKLSVDGETHIWQAKIPVRETVSLFVECRPSDPAPDAAELSKPGTHLTLHLRRLN
jgi:hypothetical protein